MLCDKCEKRELCATLCPEAELFVAQDEIDQSPVESLSGLLRPRRFPEFKEGTHLTATESKILTCKVAHLSDKEIAQTLDIPYNSIRVHWFNIRKKYLNS